MNYVSRPKDGFKAYWTNSSYNELIRERIIERNYDYVKDNLEKLIKDEPIINQINENVVFSDLKNHRKEPLWSLLLFSGYLKAQPLPEQEFTSEKLRHFQLTIPNYEIKQLFKDIVTEWLIDIMCKYQNHCCITHATI